MSLPPLYKYLSVEGAKLTLGNKCFRFDEITDVTSLSPDRAERGVLLWGRDRIGVGLLKALRSGQILEFEDRPSPYDWVASPSKHLVVCEQGEDLAEVIAANYAHALDAGLFLIPPIARQEADDILEVFYSCGERPDLAPADAQAGLVQELLNRCGSLPIPEGGTLTFIGQLPYGFAYPEYPSTHLFHYPDLGCAVSPPSNLRSPARVSSCWSTPARRPRPRSRQLLSYSNHVAHSSGFIKTRARRSVRSRRWSNTSRTTSSFLQRHCGDSSGYRRTYKYIDSEGIDRTMVIDLAVGFEATDDPDMLKVGHYFRFVSLDGIDSTDRQAKSRHYIGQAVHDFNRLMDDGPSQLEPTTNHLIERVIGSAAMMMADSNMLFAQHTIANMVTPIVVNNACVSWHRLAGNMTFAGARAYIGTLFPVTPFEASEVVTRLLDGH